MLHKSYKKINNLELLRINQKSKDGYISRNFNKIQLHNPNKINSNNSPQSTHNNNKINIYSSNSNKSISTEKNNFSKIINLSKDEYSETPAFLPNYKVKKIIKNLKIINKRNNIIKKSFRKKIKYNWKNVKSEYYIPILNVKRKGKEKEKENFSLDFDNSFKKKLFHKYNLFGDEYYDKNINKKKFSRNSLYNSNNTSNKIAKNQKYPKLFIDCKSTTKNKSLKNEESCEVQKNTKLGDLIDKQIDIIRKRLREQIIRRNKSYYTHAFKFSYFKNNNDNDDKELLKSFVINNSLSQNNIDKNDNLILSRIPKAKIPEFLKFGENPNNYKIIARNKVVNNYELKID